MKQIPRTQLNKPLKPLIFKVVLLGVSLAVVLAMCVYMTVAWYTKMVSVTGLEFKVAEWDFTANYAGDDIIVNVYEYSTINWSETEQLAAPGTAGYIPLKLGAWQSDTDVQFTLLMDRSTMSEDFQKRIFFYCWGDADGNILNQEEEGARKIYLQGSPENPTDTTQHVMTGYVNRSGETEVRVFWEWVYTAPTGSTPEQIETWDEFDTQVGKNPKIYKYDMNAKITIAGVQVEPTLKQNPPAT